MEELLDAMKMWNPIRYSDAQAEIVSNIVSGIRDGDIKLLEKLGESMLIFLIRRKNLNRRPLSLTTWCICVG